jgi:hypothetical protein
MSKKAPFIRDARGNRLKAGDTVYLHLQEPLILATISVPRAVGNGTYEARMDPGRDCKQVHR